MPAPSVHRSIDLDCPPDEAWRAVSEPDELATWLADDLDLDDVAAGEPLHATLDDGDERDGVIEEVADGEHVRFRWWNADFEESEVEIRVDAIPGGSRVSVTERLLTPALAPVTWGPKLQALAFAPVA